MAGGRVWRYSPAIRLVPDSTKPVGNAAGIVNSIALSLNSASGQLGAGTYYYRVQGFLDGAGEFHGLPTAHNAASNTSVVVAAPSTSITVSWNSISNARVYRVYRSKDAGATYGLAYVGTDRTFIDYAPSVRLATIENTSTASTTWEQHLAPWSAGFAEMTSCTLRYVDETDPMDMVNPNRRIITREFGVRPEVEMEFIVEPGSASELALATIYAGKLAYPSVRMYLAMDAEYGSLSGAANAATWREVRLVGDWGREKVGSKTVKNRIVWRFVGVDVLDYVPDFGHATDIAAGKGLW